jgi:hypothetical protein
MLHDQRSHDAMVNVGSAPLLKCRQRHVQAGAPSSAPPSLQDVVLQAALSAVMGPLVADLYQTPAGQALQSIFGSESKLARACTMPRSPPHKICCSLCSTWHCHALSMLWPR